MSTIKKAKIEDQNRNTLPSEEKEVVFVEKSKLYLHFWQHLTKDEWQNFPIKESDTFERAYIDYLSSKKGTFVYKKNDFEYLVDFENLKITCLSQETHLTKDIRRLRYEDFEGKYLKEPINRLSLLDKDVQNFLFERVLHEPENSKVFAINCVHCINPGCCSFMDFVFSKKELADEILDRYGFIMSNGWCFRSIIQKSVIIDSIDQFEELIKKVDSKMNIFSNGAMKRMYESQKPTEERFESKVNDLS